MAVCHFCDQEMTTADGCNPDPFYIGGVEYPPIPHDGDKRCHDCACLPGHLHHLGCDAEKCPACGWQAISCDCQHDPEP